MRVKYGAEKSKYCYEGMDILKNKLDIRDSDLLSEADAAFSAQRLLELQKHPMTGAFDFEHLQRIHAYIFQDIYDFAGQIRKEDISKGTTHFANWQFIISSGSRIFEALKAENFLRGTPPQIFSERTAHFMAELNVLHPFREGNGRTLREFIRCLALSCGYILSWDAVDGAALLEASIQSVLDITSLSACILKTIGYEEDKF